MDLLFAKLDPSPSPLSEYVERIAAILLNASVGQDPSPCIDYCLKHDRVGLLARTYKKLGPTDITARARLLSLAGKLSRSGATQVCEQEIWVRAAYEALVGGGDDAGEKDAVVRIFAQGLRSGSMSEAMKKLGIPELKFLKAMKVLLAEAYTSERMERFVNVCGALSAFLHHFPDWAEMLRETVPLLINVAKEKVDVLRKNAAILLAKLAKNEKLLPYIRELHGIEVLMAVGGAVLK